MAPGNDDLEPGVRRFQRRIMADYARLETTAAPSLADRRAVAEAVRRPWTDGGPAMSSTEERQVGPLEVPVRIHRPSGRDRLPVLVYLHGGGWALFSLATHDRLMREYAARAGVAVLGIGYSLAPEAPFPRALEETLAVLEWLVQEGAGNGLDPVRFAIGGDSAGANLALGACLRLRAAGRPGPRGMLLNYGAYDMTLRPSHERYDGPDYLLTTREMREFWRLYLGALEAAPAPEARPLLADLAGLPPAFLCIPECDILADENRALGARLAAAGVPATVRTYPGATHSFLEAVEVSPLAGRALDEAAAWLAGILDGGR